MTDSKLDKYNLCIANAETKLKECRGSPDSTSAYLTKVNKCNETHLRDKDACGTKPINDLEFAFESSIPSDSKWGSAFF